MPTEQDLATVRRLYAAVAAGDLAAIGECFREDAVWHLPGTSALAGIHRGWPAIRDDLLAKQGPLSGDTFRARLLDPELGHGLSPTMRDARERHDVLLGEQNWRRTGHPRHRLLPGGHGLRPTALKT